MILTEEAAKDYCSRAAGATVLRRLEDLVLMLKQENARQNLVAKATVDEIWRRHIVDSLQLDSHVPRETDLWLDLGSGAGFPGLVIAAARPHAQVVLVESRKLRVEWLQRAAALLNLSNVEVIGSRLEAAATRSASVISARAFAPLPKLLALAKRFSTPDTYWVLPKGRSAVQELGEQAAAVQRMFHVEQSLTDPEAGIIVGQGVPELR